MPRARNPDRDKAFEIYKTHKGEIALVEIATKLELTAGTIRGWKSKDKWDAKLNGTFQTNTERSKRKRGGQPGNKNAKGHGGPVGNLKALKHGAYQTIYYDMLPADEKDIYNKLTAEAQLDEEIKLLRLKLAKLLSREKTFFYTMFGEKLNKEIAEEDRDKGILICLDQLRKLIATKAKMGYDTEKLQIEYEKLRLLKLKQGEGETNEQDDGFLEALQGSVAEVWADEQQE